MRVVYRESGRRATCRCDFALGGISDRLGPEYASTTASTCTARWATWRRMSSQHAAQQQSNKTRP